MKIKRAVVQNVLLGWLVGMVAEVFCSYAGICDYSLTACIICSVFGAVLFGLRAHKQLKPKRVAERVEQVVGVKLTVGDCYESIVIEQREF
ncbi:MAG: hypothetical protein M0Z78_08755 [Betaproteobacteria bacterium]|nr:hypothetical protein [Betaproteobacteria bacterium]